MKYFQIIITFILLQLSVDGFSIIRTADYQTVPLPNSITKTNGKAFQLDAAVTILYSENDGEAMKKNADFLAEYIHGATRLHLTITSYNGQNESGNIRLAISDNMSDEAYAISITSDKIKITGGSSKGVFYGIQTLRKSMPISEQKISMNDFTPLSSSQNRISFNHKSPLKILFPTVEIKDAPRFAYRGMHLDVCRHFFSADFVKKYLDLLALHGINTLHWHITDDQGWRVEIKKYPLLTEIGSIRNRTVVGKYDSGIYDETPYGGFYSQEEIRDIVAYAADRYITIIPEVDLPGHTLALLAAYPNLGCTGGPYEVCPDWGIFPDVLCLGNEDSYQFLFDVFDEITDLFPSKLIHIGGDEAPRDRWKVCPKCQAKIHEVGLATDSLFTAEDRLQTYCMARVAEHLKSKGRKVIGWDEILDGDAIEGATVMSWRGQQTCLNALRHGKDVVLVPTTHFYFDYYQTDDIDNEPLSIGGYIPVEKVYSYEPIPEGISAEDAAHILGLQANIWTEYIHTEEHLEYMVLPRMAALSEIQWMQPEKKNFNSFVRRIGNLMELYGKLGYNYSKHIFDIKAEFTPTPNGVLTTLSTVDNAPIYYSLNDDTEETEIYTEPFLITQTSDLYAFSDRINRNRSELHRNFTFSKATLKAIDLDTTYLDSKYTFEGATTLVDGLHGDKNFSTGRWLGFIGGNVVLTIDLGKKQKISEISTTSFVDHASWIMALAEVEVFTSTDNVNFTKAEIKPTAHTDELLTFGLKPFIGKFNQIKARYVKLVLHPATALPKGHPGEGQYPFLFIDEISIN